MLDFGKVTLFLFLWLPIPLTDLARAQATTADLEGTVRDQSGGVLSGVMVTVSSKAVALSRSAVSGDSGLYRIPALPPGTYQVRAELSGFAAQVRDGVTLNVGEFAALDFTMTVSATETEVIVEADAQILEVSKTQLSETISQTQIDNLPINGRNYLDFTLLTPGVTGRNTMVRFAAVQAPTSGLSFSGQNGRSNNITIDGVSNIDSASNAALATLSQEGISEFQINRSSFSAEFGRAQGGVINIVTKSGTNSPRGNAFYFVRDQVFDARNAFASGPVEPTFRRKQYGATFGGPIARDRAFFFASFERLARNESLFVTFLNDPGIFGLTPSQRALLDFLGQAPVPSLRQLAAILGHPQAGILNTTAATFPQTLALFERESGTFPFEANQNTFSLKNDFVLSNANQLFTRFSATSGFNDNTEFGALKGVSNGVSFDTQDIAFVVSDTHIFNPRRLNEFKFQFSRRENKVLTNDPIGPQITLAGIADFGREFFNPTRYTSKLFEFVDNVTLVAGNHTLKTGVDYNYTRFRGAAEVFLGGRFFFSGSSIPLGLVLNSVAGPTTATEIATALAQLGRPDLIPNLQAPISAVQSFNFGLPTSFFQGFGDPNTRFSFPQLGIYIQDSWKALTGLTFSLGLRYDVEWRPKTSNVTIATPPFQFDFRSVNDTNNVAPRFGFSWAPWASGTTVVRGGYGLFYASFYNAIAFVGQVLSGQISQVFVPLTGLPGTPATSATVFADFRRNGPLTADRLRALGLPPGRTPSIILPQANDIETPYSHQASFGIERELLPDLAIAIDYNLNRGVHIIRSRDINVRQIGPNRFSLPGLDPRFVQINQIETTGTSIYHGLAISGRKRFSRGHSYQISYTLGKAIDDATDFITPLQPNNQRDLRAERSLSAFDERHRLVVSAVLASKVESPNTWARNVLSDWTLSPVFTYASGKPFNLLVGFDANGDTHDETDRPSLPGGQIAGRNTGRGPNFIAFDLRLARKLSFQPDSRVNLELIAEAFNLFNRVNFSGVNNVVSSSLSSFDVAGRRGAPTLPLGFTSAFDPRQIQLGVKLNF
ncbi:MAG: TonB-dependent receptor [Acidobacteria bacterium]|nr:TonB-dependent receptor [Acidobacteriota bacterium]